MSDSIFNERGVLRTDLHNVHIPPEQRPALDALVSAVMAAEEAEHQLKIKDRVVADKEEAHARARAAYVPGTFMDEWKTAVACFQKRRR
jgi:hypothetical protein